jgi:hypothetical protein
LNIKKLLTDQKFENLVNEYVYEGSKYYVYKGEKLSNVYSISENLNQVEKEHENFIKRVLNNEHIYWSDMYEFNVYRGIDFASTTNWNPNNTYLNSSMVKYADNYNNSTYFKLNFNRKVNSAILIASNFEPFWYKELKASCKETSCNYNNFLSLTYALRKSGIISLENKTIPDELVKRYIDAYWKTVNGSVQSR